MTTNDEQVSTIADGLTIHQAALQLGMSQTTIRRRIKDGSLKASRIPTSQGFEWRILLDEQAPATSGAQLVTNGENLPTNSEEGPAIGDQVPTSDDQLATITDEVASSVMEQLQPLLEQLNAERDRGNELQRQNVELAGRCGYLQARLEASERQVLALTTPQEPERTSAAWWRRLLGMQPA